MTAVQLPLGDFAHEYDSSLSQYFTPQALARRMVEWAGVKGKTVLEPSAGGGNIVRELVLAGARTVVAVEIDVRWAARLCTEFAYPHPVLVKVGDFLAIDPAPVDLAVMNGPLNDGVGAAHVARALEWAPRVVALLRAHDLHTEGRFEQLWSRCDLAREAKLVKRPVFSGEGGKTEFVVVDVYRRGTYAGPQRIEHWVI